MTQPLDSGEKYIKTMSAINFFLSLSLDRFQFRFNRFSFLFPTWTIGLCQRMAIGDFNFPRESNKKPLKG
jgi:hypothetical protein